MQTITKTISRSRADTTNLIMPNYGLMAIPVINGEALSEVYEQATQHLFQADKELKQNAAKTVLQSKKLNLINDIDINREFKRHDKGEIVETELLTTLTELCGRNLYHACLDDAYHMDMDIKNGHCVLTGYDINEIYIDTSTLAHDERALIYSSLELVATYILPMMPPGWYLHSTYSFLGEITDNDEFDKLSSLAMEHNCVDALIERIATDESFEYLDYFLSGMDGDLNACVTALLDYEFMDRECSAFNAYQKDNGLTWRYGDGSEEKVVKKHIKCLNKCNSIESKYLLRVLKALLKSKLYTRFEAIETDDAQPLDFSITIIDAPYSALITYLQEAKIEELNQVGEPLCEAITYDENTIKRLNLLTYAFHQFNQMSKEKRNES